MFKICAIILLAASCLGIPVKDDDVNAEDVVRQYRIEAEDYFKKSFSGKIDYYDSEKVKFFLYTNQEPNPHELKYHYFMQYLKNSSFDSTHPTKILIHDRFFSGNFFNELISAYLRYFPKPVNVIVMDYSYYSGAEQEAFMGIFREIGKTFAHFVEELQSYGNDGDKIHVIGHGIGAHIAASAARELSSFQFGRITGLCPTGLEFDEDKTLPQLMKYDADYVDIISTNAGAIGSSQQDRGHTNFYPHGGASQPKSTMFLSHLKAYFYFVESVSRGKVFKAFAANSYTDFKTDKYNRDKVNYMGEYIHKNETGNFYLDVQPVPPYSTFSDPLFQRGKNNINEAYLKSIMDTDLAPFVFMSKDGAHFVKAVAHKD